MMVPVPQTRILVAEDEQSILDVLCASLRHAGFAVLPAHDGLEAVDLARSQRPDLLVLDVMMPGHDGFEVVKILRGEANMAPVLFLTARDATQDKVRGLTAGGDDYVTKPFSLDEVQARVRALLRRADQKPAPVGRPRLTVDDLRLDVDRHEVRRAGQVVDLTPTEFNLLRLFMENPGRVLSKQTILDRVWDQAFDGDPTIVESYVSYLRRKIDGDRPRLLHTVRGVGYVLRADR